MNSSKVKELLLNKLKQFDLDLDKDIVASTSDAASVLVKFEKDTSSIHIRCFSHRLHLGVCKISNCNKYRDLSVRSDDEDDEESESRFTTSFMW